MHRHLLKLRTALGATPLNVAIAGGHVSAVRHVALQCINYACTSCLTNVCRMLLEHGASVDETDIDRDDEHGNHEHCPTPVATSALYARENVLRALLEVTPESSGAAVPVTGWTPLMLAASSGNKARG